MIQTAVAFVLQSRHSSRLSRRYVASRTDGFREARVLCSSINTRLPHAPPAGIGSALALVTSPGPIAFPGI